MTDGDTVFALDGARIGRITALDEEALTMRGDGHTFKVARGEVAYEHESRVFLTARNRSAAGLWRVDVRNSGGLRGWWQRRVLGPSPRLPGGRLSD